MTSIFGHDLRDPEIEILIDNPAVRTWFAQNAQRNAVREQWQHDRSLRGKLINLLKTASKIAGLGGTITALLNSNSERQRHPEQQGNMVRKRVREEEIGANGDMVPYQAIPYPGTPELHPDERPAKGRRIITDSEADYTSRRDRARLDNRAAMEIDDGGDPAPEAAARSSGTDGPSAQSKETPISSYPSLSYGLQETHTTILPWSGWLSAVNLVKSTPVQLAIRVNTPYDMLAITTNPTPNAGALWASKGLGVKMAGTRGENSDQAFPAQLAANSTTTTERPMWLHYWAQIYEKYTVLGMEYEVIIDNPCQHVKQVQYAALSAAAGPPETIVTPAESYFANVRADAICGVQMDAYSDTAGATGNRMPQTELREVMSYKNIKWYRIEDRGNITVIRGQIKPGMAKHNIQNDGDVKTWSDTNSVTGTIPTLPTLKELLTLNFWAHPLSNTSAESSVKAQAISINMQLNLKYIVQFKDLRQQARYPNGLSGPSDGDTLIQTLSNNNSAQGTPHAQW
jgi:hypothetical protein